MEPCPPVEPVRMSMGIYADIVTLMADDSFCFGDVIASNVFKLDSAIPVLDSVIFFLSIRH